MDLRKVRVFIQVAENGSFTRAAANLATAQSVISRHIRDLEIELGVGLLHRNGRGADLTEAGQEFLYRARLLVEDADSLAADMRARSGELQGTVVIGVPPSVSHVLLAPFLERIGRDMPALRVRIMEGFSGHVYEWLLNGRIDLAVLYNVRVSGALSCDRLLIEDMFLIGRPGDPLTRPGQVRLQDIGGIPLVLPGLPHGLRTLVDAAAAAQKTKLAVHIEVDALTTIRSLVKSGTVRTILPLAGVLEELENSSLSAARIVAPAISRELVLASSNVRPSTRAKREVAGIMRRQVAELVESGGWPTSNSDVDRDKGAPAGSEGEAAPPRLQGSSAQIDDMPKPDS